MKYVYIIEIGQLSRLKNEFFFYDMEVFPSDKAAKKVINNMIDCNNGYGVVIKNNKKGDGSGFRRGEVEVTSYTYNCLSAPERGETPKSMQVRYVLRKIIVNRNF